METNLSKRTFLGSAAATVGAIFLPACSKRGEAKVAETF